MKQPNLFDMPALPPAQAMRFDGDTYTHTADQKRLSGQVLRTFDAMRGNLWLTLDEISQTTGDPHQSISARLRDLRKERFGGHTIERRRRGAADSGLWEYKLILNGAK